LVINASINPLTAILNFPNGDLLTSPTARILMGLIANEAARVSFKMGVKLPYLDPVLVVESVAQNTARNISSMLKDILRGGPTEIDAINGAIVHLGEAVDAPVQYNRSMWLLVKAMEANAGIRQ
jgi:2-dehydropantoate 2-reductase